MRKQLFLLLLVLVTLQASSQEFNFKSVDTWLEKPVLHKVEKTNDSSSAVTILDDRKREYKFVGKEFYLYETNHRIVKILNDKGIEMYNKIYVPFYRGQDVYSLKARTILKNGKVIDLPADKIKEITEEGRLYKIFAMEGVEKEAEIEYTYSIKKDVSVFGVEVFQTSSVPVQRANFTLISPQNLVFSAKGYNGFKVSKDSVIDGVRIIVGYSDNLEAIDDEKYSLKDKYYQRVDYKLSYNLLGKADVRLYTWKDFAKNVYNSYTTLASKEEKAVENLVKKMDVNNSEADAKKILQIEDYLKKNFNADEKITGEDAENLEKVIKTKNTNRSGIVKLFLAVFDKLEIPYQIVYPTDRSDFALDEELENYRLVEEVLIYFPKTKKFIAPFSVDYRYPFVPPYLAGARGLFLKTTTIGSLKTAIGSFGEVAMEPFEKHAHNMEVVMKLDDKLENVIIDSKQILLGYGAAEYRPIYNFLPKDKQDENTKEIVKSIAKTDDIKNIKVENSDLNDIFDNKPLVISATLTTPDLIEKAGNKLLIKVGDLIGKQAEMYQEKKRQLPIELGYPHVLNRTLVFEIPAGYTVKNLNDTKINVVYKDGEDVLFGFVSDYKLNGNKVEITINETYSRLYYPIAEYDHFQKVINAAADFNKIVYVLEKK